MALATEPAAPERSRLRQRLGRAALLGPAFVAAIAYVDPGNVASNVSAGAKYGYLLVWVVFAANFMAVLVQYLSAKLGIVTGKTLPEVVGSRLRRPNRIAYWLQAELVAMATDLAEVIGGSIALALLFNLPLVYGALITGGISMCLLLVQDRTGQRPFERVITGLLLVIAVGFVTSVVVAPPPIGSVLHGFQPQFDGADSVLLAAAMLGATVMPHAVYLHSALTRDRHGPVPAERRTGLIKITRIDVGLAMIFAGAVNLAMLLAAATTLRGVDNVDTIEGAHAAVRNALGPGVAILFALGLLASGIASTSVGAYAGSVIMQGLLKRRIHIIARRLITLIPAVVIVGAGIDPTRALVLSQVALSFGIPFALIPLIRITADKALMGAHVNHRLTTAAGWLVAAIITCLNIVLIYLTLS